jgi:signal transduction histidine kinase
MALSLRSLKTRAALVSAAAMAVVLGANALYGFWRHRQEEADLRRTFEQHATGFARLTYQGLAEAFEQVGPHRQRLEVLAASYLDLEPDFEGIVLLDREGHVLHQALRKAERRPALPAAAAVREAARGGRLEILRDPDPANGVQILAPYPPGGPARVVVAYLYTPGSLEPTLARHQLASVSVSVVSVLAAMLVALVLASRITRPIEQLTRGALEIGEGHFERRLPVRGDDEVQILARTFNEMADRLKENIAQLEDSNRRLARLNEELQELDRTKSDLLANVSHELRTPLTAIKGYTDYILEGKLGPVGEKQEKGLIVIQRNLDRLARSINALLDFSTLDVGRIALNLQPFALPMLVEQIHQALRSEFDRKQITFSARLPAELPQVIADRDRLAQVLENLLINAIKFTSTGGEIGVSALRLQDRDKPEVELAVRDSGIGIPAAEVGRIFNRFHQVDGTSTRRYGGVGLGLAIVKGILDAHGAPITVDSVEGHGSIFRIRLPVYEREEGRTGTPLPGYP